MSKQSEKVTIVDGCEALPLGPLSVAKFTSCMYSLPKAGPPWLWVQMGAWVQRG
jgi:hypothetical protein